MHGASVSIENWQCIFDTGTTTVAFPPQLHKAMTSGLTSLEPLTLEWNLKSQGATPAVLNMTFPTAFLTKYSACYSMYEKCVSLGKKCPKALASSTTSCKTEILDLGISLDKVIPGDSASCIWGLPMLLWLEQVTMDFTPNNEFFQAKVRATPITAPFSELPEKNLAH